ncbi:MAG: LamG-like jellyroll fold domain-containing protein, partial [Bacteroidota bacterium]
MKRVFLLLVLCISFVSISYSQVIDYNDPIVEYDENNPPTTPGGGVLAKWVKTDGVSWNTAKWKAYYLNGTPFRLRFPNDYDPTQNYPMVVILHGLGFSNGTIYMNERHLNNSGAKAYEDGINQGKYDGFVLSPQSSTGWFNETHISTINQFINQAVQDVSIDVDRVSINGRSGGSQGVWEFISKSPKTYASALPMAGIKSLAYDYLNDFKHLPIWAFQGELDEGPRPAATEALLAAYIDLGGNARYSFYKNSGHGIFNKGYAEPDYFDYIERASKTNPTVLTGEYTQVYDDNSKSIYEFLTREEPCPGDVINIQIGVTAGFDGYEWRKDGVILSGATSNEFNVTELGTYDVRIRRGSDWSDWSLKPVEVKLKDPTITPNIAISGIASKVLPTLDGSTTVDLELPQGYTEYEWRKVSDNTLVGSQRVLTVTEPGEYAAKVTEQFGCSSSFSNAFNVVDANGTEGPAELLEFNGFAQSQSEVKLIWSTNPSDPFPASGFEVYRATSETGSYEFIHLVDGSVYEYINSDLTPNTDYFFKVRAVNESGSTQGNEPIQVKTLVDDVAPTAPSNLQLIAINPTSAELTWEKSSDNVSVYRYDIFKNGVKALTVDTSAAILYNLQPNAIYKFTVQARDVTGNISPISNRIVTVTPISSIGLTNYKFNNNLIDIGLSEINSALNGNTSYDNANVQEGTHSITFDGDGDYIDFDTGNNYIHDEFSQRSVAFWIYPKSSTGIQDIFDEGGATNGFGIRLNSSTIELGVQDDNRIRIISSPITINLWTHVTGTFDEGKLSLYLNGALVAENLNVGYTEVSGHTDASGLGGTNGSNAFDLNSANFNGNIDDLHVFDKAITTLDINSLMNPEEVTILPDDKPIAPENIVASAQSHKQILVTWNDLSDNEESFQVYRSINGGTYLPISSLPPNSVSYLDENLAAETTYAYQVIAVSEYSQSDFLSTENIASLANLKFEGNIDDVSGNGTNDTVVGHLNFANDFVEGSQSISFDGSSLVNLDQGNQYVHDSFAKRSIAFWFKSISSANTQDIFDEGGATNGIGIRLLASDEIEFGTRNGHVSFTVSSAFMRDTWHHVTGVFDSGELTLFLDGQQVAQRNDVSYSAVNSHGNAGGLGGTNGSNAFNQVSNRFTGLVDDFYIFDEALTQLEVEGLIASATPSHIATTFSLPDPPSAPGNLLLDNVTFTEATISFDDNSNNEDFFEVWRSVNTADNFQLYQVISDYNDPRISFVDGTLTTNILYYYKVLAINDGGSSESSTIEVQTLNTVPEVNTINDVTMQFGTVYEVQIQAFDENSDPLTISTDNIPAFASFVDYGDGSALISFTPTVDDLGIYDSIGVTVSDGFGGINTQSFALTVNNNSVPTLSSINDIITDENQSIQVAIVANDVEGTANIIWSFDLPTFANVTTNPDGTATLSVTPGFADHGLYESSITVTDQDGGVVTREFFITVNDIDPNLFVQVNMKYASDGPAGWNNVSTADLIGLDDIVGSSSGISFDFLTGAWNSFNQGASSTSDVFPNSVLKDYYYFGIFGAPETVEMELSGLDTERTYNLSFMSSSVWSGVSDNGTTNFEINGQVVGVYTQNNTENTADFNEITPTADGKISVTMSKAAGTQVGYLNGFTLSSVLGSTQVPDAPRTLTGIIDGATVQLSWIDAPFNETGFNVYRSATSDDNFIKLNDSPLPASSESFEDGTTVEGLTYFYKVSATNVNGESPFSNTLELTVPNTPPSIVVSESVELFTNQIDTIQFSITDLPLNEFTYDVIGLPSFASHTSESSQVVFSPTTDDIGNYTFQIQAIDGLNSSTTKDVTITVSEDLIYAVSVNFSKVSNAPSPWNNTAKNPVSGDVYSNLIDQNGQPTDVDVTLMTSFGLFDQGAVTGDDSGVIPDAALAEYYYFGRYGIPSQVKLKISGLDFNNKYNFKFVGSSTFSNASISDNGSTVYKIGNKSASLYVQDNTQNFALIENVTANAQGEIEIDMEKGSGALVGYINALIIEAYAGEETLYFPTELEANAHSKNSIELTWNDNSFDENGYEIYRSSNGPDGTFELIALLGADSDNYLDTNLSQGTIYHYKVRSVTGAEFSEFTNT